MYGSPNVTFLFRYLSKEKLKQENENGNQKQQISRFNDLLYRLNDIISRLNEIFVVLMAILV